MWVVRSWKNKRERTRHDERTAVKKILSAKVLDVPKEQRAREFGWEVSRAWRCHQKVKPALQNESK